MENERLARVEENISNIKEDVKEMKDMLTSHVVREEKKYAQMDNKFAPKWVEKFVIAIIVGFVIVIFGFIKSNIG